MSNLVKNQKNKNLSFLMNIKDSYQKIKNKNLLKKVFYG